MKESIHSRSWIHSSKIYKQDLNLAGIDSESLGEQLLGFQTTLDIAIEQISLSLDEKIGTVRPENRRAEASVAGFDDTFDAFSDTNLAMSTEIRRVVQSNARLEEFEADPSGAYSFGKREVLRSCYGANRDSGRRRRRRRREQARG